jgi:hypothetical protein
MFCHAALEITDVLEERIASIIGVTRIGLLGTTFAVISSRSTLRRNSIHPSIHPPTHPRIHLPI